MNITITMSIRRCSLLTRLTVIDASSSLVVHLLVSTLLLFELLEALINRDIT
jgi:hypothetical protein